MRTARRERVAEVLPCLDGARGVGPGPDDLVVGDVPDVVRPEVEARDDPEVPAASSAAGPEEVGVLTLAALAELSVGGDERESHHVVARQPELAPGVTDPASLRVAGDADRRTGPRGDRAAACRERRVDVDRRAPAPTVATPSRRWWPSIRDTSTTTPALVVE